MTDSPLDLNFSQEFSSSDRIVVSRQHSKVVGLIMEDEVIAPFLKPIRDLTQNFNVNLVELLEDYRNKMGISDPDEALDSRNFAAAAIVLQQSANIYGKKVDYLWELLMQVIQSTKSAAKRIIAEKKDGEIQPDQDICQDFCEIDEETLFCGDVNINLSKEPYSDIQFLPKYNPHLEAAGSDKRNLVLYDPQANVIGKKYDFRVNRYLSSEGLLMYEPTLHEEVCACRDRVSGSQSVITEVVPDGGTISDGDVVDECLMIKSFHESCVPDNLGDSFNSRFDEDCPHTDKSAKISREPDKIINICEDPWKPVPMDKVMPNKKFVKKVTYVVPPDLVNITDEEARRKVFEADMEKRKNPQSILSFLTSNFQREIVRGNDYLIHGEYLFLLHRLKKSCQDEAVTDVEKFQADFEEMAKKLAEEFNYSPDSSYDKETREQEEDKFIEVENLFVDEESDVENLDMFVNDVRLPILDHLGGELKNQLVIPPVLEDDLTYEEYAAEAFRVVPLETEEVSRISAKVTEWHDKLGPKLTAASERGHLDVNVYAAKIIKSFPDVGGESGQSTLPFRDFVEDEVTEEVPRFFLVALMLANSYNIGIRKSSENPLEMDCTDLTLLNPVLNNVFGDTDSFQ